MQFETITFFDYDIRSTVIDGVRMYLVSDLLSQYNEKHGTNKEFKKYLRNKETQEMLINRMNILEVQKTDLQCHSSIMKRNGTLKE